MDKADSPSSVPASLPWSVPVAADNIPDSGLHMEIDAPAPVRAKVLDLVAGLASVHDLPRLSGVFDLTRKGSKVHVTGQVQAHVGQACVVTLEPLESDVDEAVDLTFAPASELTQPAAEYDSFAPEDGTEPPEPLRDGAIDLGAIAIEFLVLGVNPYPRKPGAEFAPVKIGKDDAHPFAALAALKKPPGDEKP